MPTTIQVTNETLGLLRNLRKSRNAESYNEVILKAIRDSQKSESMFGSLKTNKSFKQLMKGLRDEDDRF